jgi:hypothetical protein
LYWTGVIVGRNRRLEGGAIAPREMNDEVAILTINGREHKFSFFELGMVLPHLTEESRSAMKKEPVRAQLELLARMYAQRFPCIESERHPPQGKRKDEDLTS